MHKPDDRGRGRITEPGELLQRGAVFRNITVRNNSFVAPAAITMPNAFIHIGAAAGVDVSGNSMARPGATADGSAAKADVVLYSATRATAHGNVCSSAGARRNCTVSEAP